MFNRTCSVCQSLLLPLLDTYACFSFVQIQMMNFGGQDYLLLFDSAKHIKALIFAWDF